MIPRMRFSPLFSLALIALLAPGCGGALRGTVVVGPQEFPGFPAHADDGVLMVEATLFTNHEDIFGEDLTRFGYLPVAIRVGVRERDGVVRRLSEDTLDAHLYLQDGTPLPWIPYEDIELANEGVLDRIARRALVLSVLPEWHDAHAGFIFFRFDEDVRIDGTHALTRDGEYYREIDLLQSLLSLDVSTSTGPQRLNVGLRSGHHSDR
jgi:hypothetical protein